MRYKASELPSEAKIGFELPALTAGIQNQGLNNFVPKENATILQNVISISANGANTGATFFQSKDFTILQDAYAIRWIYTENILSNNHYLYLTACISKRIYGYYEWTNKVGWERVKQETIYLPITQEGQIDFEFMEGFIAELEAEHIAELEAYLLATGLKDTTLTPQERQALKDFADSSGGAKYKIGELFEIISSKHIYHANELQEIYDDQIEGSLPYVVRMTKNNGVRGYILENLEYANDANTLSFAQDTFSVFYQKQKYFTGNKVKILKPKFTNTNENIMRYITASLQKALINLSWGIGSTIESIREMEFMIPITQDGQIDFNFMENFISAIQKLVIQDVVLYAEQKIQATREAAKLI